MLSCNVIIPIAGYLEYEITEAKGEDDAIEQALKLARSELLDKKYRHLELQALEDVTDADYTNVQVNDVQEEEEEEEDSDYEHRPATDEE